MEKWKQNFLFFLQNKVYIAVLSLTALLGYGFLVTHGTVGIDDTPFEYYFEEGLNVIVGRWFLFVLNKFFHVSDFAPFITDLAGVLILMVAVTVWATLFYSVCKDMVPMWGYLFFSCIFLSSPLISEVYTYHLHNGISVGYVCTGVSLCFFKELSESFGNWKRTLVTGLGSIVFLFVALGCYESLMIVWLVGLLLLLLVERYRGLHCKVFLLLAVGAMVAVGAMLLRSVMIRMLISGFGLEELRGGAIQRSVTEMLGWMFESEGLADFKMALKRVYVMYFAFGYAYYPIRIFVFSVIFMFIYGVYRAIRGRDMWIAILTCGCFGACFLLVVIEGSATLYRAAQFLPLVCGYGALLISMAVGELKDVKVLRKENGLIYRVGSCAVLFGLSVILWNQCFDLNRWFYVDWQKYQYATEVAEQIALELETNYDTTKPVVFTGTCQPPRGIVEDAYVELYTENYYKILRLTNLVDDGLIYKFYRDYGVWVAQTPTLYVLDWGVNAFGTSVELQRFFNMHGYGIIGNTDPKVFEDATNISMEWPEFPSEGSIVDMGDYIIVHF